MSRYVCVFCGAGHPAGNAPDGGDIRCCGEVGKVTPAAQKIIVDCRKNMAEAKAKARRIARAENAFLVKDARTRASLSQPQAARLVGVTERTIRRWEHNITAVPHASLMLLLQAAPPDATSD